jgi:hypothetical protein
MGMKGAVLRLEPRLPKLVRHAARQLEQPGLVISADSDP